MKIIFIDIILLRTYALLVIHETCKNFLLNSTRTKIILHENFLHGNLLDKQKQITVVTNTFVSNIHVFSSNQQLLIGLE